MSARGEDTTDELVIIRDMYLVKKYLGKGKFGVVLLAINLTNQQYVAIKTEKSGTENSSIKHEVRMMNYLFRNRFNLLPKIHWYGVENGSTYLVMCHFDRSLDQAFAAFDPETLAIRTKLCVMMVQAIRLLEELHELLVIHRDIKPQNFMIKDQQLFLIDYGLATFYADSDGEHLPNKPQETVTGTPLFISYNNHVGNNLSRRDDLISLGYTALFLYRKTLPWQCRTMDLSHIAQQKRGENIAIFSQNFPELRNYLQYCYTLDYSEDPDYDQLCDLFTVALPSDLT